MAKSKKNGRVSWSEDEVKLLKKLFPLRKARQIAEQVGRPLTTVRQKAYSMGLKTRECHRLVNGVKQKRCSGCGKWKAESEFYKNRCRKDGLAYSCKECANKATNGSRRRRRLAVRN